MPGVPDRFVRVVEELPGRFTRQEARALADWLREATVDVYLSKLTSEGSLVKVATNTFERSQAGSRPATSPSRLVRSMLPAATRRLTPSALARTVWWSHEDLVPFTHDAIIQGFLVVETPASSREAVVEALAPRGRLEEVKWRTKLGEAIWPRTGARQLPEILVANWLDLAGTAPAKGGILVPRTERIFMDLLSNGTQLPGAASAALHSPDFEIDLVLRIAASWRRSAEVASFLTAAAMRDPEAPFAGRVQERFPQINAAMDRGGW